MAKGPPTFLNVAKDSEIFPKTELGKILANQLLRATGSISANVAEGFGRRQGKEYLHYLIVARGSTTETLNWLIKCLDLGWITQEIFSQRETLCRELLKMLNKMIAQKLNH